MRRCAPKENRHETRDDANKARAALRAAHRLPADALSVYKCDQCLGYHVGRSSGAFITRQRRSGKRANRRMRGR